MTDKNNETDEMQLCPECDSPLRNNFENLGFDENPYFEVVELYCPVCGYKESIN